MKRRRTSNLKIYGTESDAEENSLSPSQNSSPSQSDQEQIPSKKSTEVRAPQVFPIFKQQSATPICLQSNHVPLNQPNHKIIIPRTRQELRVLGEHQNQSKPHNPRAVNMRKHEVHFPADEHRSLETGQLQNMVC